MILSDACSGWLASGCSLGSLGVEQLGSVRMSCQPATVDTWVSWVSLLQKGWPWGLGLCFPLILDKCYINALVPQLRKTKKTLRKPKKQKKQFSETLGWTPQNQEKKRKTKKTLRQPKKQKKQFSETLGWTPQNQKKTKNQKTLGKPKKPKKTILRDSWLDPLVLKTSPELFFFGFFFFFVFSTFFLVFRFF